MLGAGTVDRKENRKTTRACPKEKPGESGREDFNKVMGSLKAVVFKVWSWTSSINVSYWLVGNAPSPTPHLLNREL